MLIKPSIGAYGIAANNIAMNDMVDAMAGSKKTASPNIFIKRGKIKGRCRTHGF